jgi:hypothetical protein
LQAAFDRRELRFFGNLARFIEPMTFARHLKQLRDVEWIVYAKRPFGGPQQVLEYLGVKRRRTMTPGSTMFNPLAFLHFLVATRGHDRRRS